MYEGKLLECKDDLHVRTITAITFFNPLKQLVTGAMDGTSMFLDIIEICKLQLSVFSTLKNLRGSVKFFSVYTSLEFYTLHTLCVFI